MGIVSRSGVTNSLAVGADGHSRGNCNTVVFQSPPVIEGIPPKYHGDWVNEIYSDFNAIVIELRK